jgi:5-methyltetrahydrofolate--homocysteine methyltransferase
MVKKYGFKAIISLVGKTIPRTVKQRLHNVRVALRTAKKVGFPREDLIFDPLVFSIATEKEQVVRTLETASILNKRGLKTVLGISNVSFGLPGRSRLNATLAVAAIKHGVTFLIVNPLDETVMESILSAQALFKGSVISFSERMRSQTIHQRKAIVKERKQSSLFDAIVHGNGRQSSQSVRKLLDTGLSAQRVLDDYITVALKKVGDNYEAGDMFIPDLLAAADASKQALCVVKEYLPKNIKQGTIMLATVKGDIHDIGKNIAAMMFESAGYDVIDLGKDVSCEKIVRAVKKYKPDILGLSALLTTTMPEMERVIDTLKKKKLAVKVIIGGPNVSDQYARRIGAYAAAKDVLKGLQIVKAIM